MQKLEYLRLAKLAYRTHKALHPLTHYTGILSLHGFARLAIMNHDRSLLEECRADLMPFIRREYQFRCNYQNYRCGGNGAAFLYWQGKLPEVEDQLKQYAEELCHRAPRDANGIYCMSNRGSHDLIWVDSAFAVTPFLLFAGLAFEEDAYIEEAYQQIAKMYHIFRDPENGLLHQSKNFAGTGKISEDHWSRGNGWGLLALSELVCCLAADDPRRKLSEQMFRDLVHACLKHQDEQGVWHQEITEHSSYVETSGTGLILYAIGVGLEKRLLAELLREQYLKGLHSYRAYIGDNGSVYHTCRGCLCPNKGTINDYKLVPPVLNDPHAFGPVILAFGQAYHIS